MSLSDDDRPLGGELPNAEEASREARLGFMPEFVRKIAVAGLGALFMTEEGIRNLAGQLKLPKEMLGYILNQAEKTKDELGRVVSEELRRFLQSEKLREEILRLVAGMTLEVKAELRLKPTSKEGAEGAGPQLKITELQTRRAGKKKE
jgi:hypothetical protein